MSNIPSLISVQQGKVSLNQNFIDYNNTINWSPERQIEVLWKTAYDVLYKKDIQQGRITQEFAEKKLQALNHAYAGVKHKFQDIERNYGGRYFDHQLRVAYNILTKSKKPSLRKVLIALHHDSIEDTDYDFSTLQSTLNEKIGLGVLAISKEPFTDFIKTSESKKSTTGRYKKRQERIYREITNTSWNFLSLEYLEKKFHNPEFLTPEQKQQEKKWLDTLSDQQKFEIIQEIGILNRKGLLSDKFISKQNFKPEKITVYELFAFELYESLNKKYKNLRNDVYFSHMTVSYMEKQEPIIYDDDLKKYPCLNKFFGHILSLEKKRNLNFSRRVLKDIMMDALEVKFWDRLDNLSTSEIYHDDSEESLKKAQRKIIETESYFYHISKEFDIEMGTDFFSMILFEIQRLKSFIKEKEIHSITYATQTQTSQIIEK